MILFPEGAIKLQGTGRQVLERCDGARTLAEIVDDLAATYRGERSRIEADVRRLLADLVAKKMVEL